MSDLRLELENLQQQFAQLAISRDNWQALARLYQQRIERGWHKRDQEQIDQLTAEAELHDKQQGRRLTDA